MADLSDFITYTITSSATTLDAARRHVEALRRVVLGLRRFEQVGNVQEFIGTACDWEHYDADDPRQALLMVATEYVELEIADVPVAPIHAIGFSAKPINCDEWTHFAVAIYPEHIEFEELCEPTNLSRSWSWEVKIKAEPDEHRMRLRCQIEDRDNQSLLLEIEGPIKAVWEG